MFDSQGADFHPLQRQMLREGQILIIPADVAIEPEAAGPGSVPRGVGVRSRADRRAVHGGRCLAARRRPRPSVYSPTGAEAGAEHTEPAPRERAPPLTTS
jgi:hypothetical protein